MIDSHPDEVLLGCLGYGDRLAIQTLPAWKLSIVDAAGVTHVDHAAAGPVLSSVAAERALPTGQVASLKAVDCCLA